jgi:DNA-binding CsgD family transcriptional regulator
MGGINLNQVKEIYRRLMAGESLTYLAKEYKTSRETVYKEFRKHGFDLTVRPCPRIGIAEHKVREICRLKKENVPVAQIAKQVGVAEDTARKYLNLSGFILKVEPPSLALYMADKADIVQRCKEAGMTEKQIAIELNVSRGTFRKYFPNSSNPIPRGGKK